MANEKLNQIEIMKLREKAIDFLPSAQKKRENCKILRLDFKSYALSLWEAATITLSDVTITAEEFAAAKLLQAIIEYQTYDKDDHEQKDLTEDYIDSCIYKIKDLSENFLKLTKSYNLSPELKLEQIIWKILAAHGFEPESKTISPKARCNFDFLATFNAISWAIEIKYYRTAQAQVSLLEAAASKLTNALHDSNYKGMLITFCNINPEIRLNLEKKYPLVFVDIADIFIWANELPEVIDQLNSLLEVRQSKNNGREIDDVIKLRSEKQTEYKDSLQTDKKGMEFREKLKTLTGGKANKSWAKYEDLCTQILQYLFTNDLEGWHKQQKTDDGLNRFDCVCRIKQTTEFWKFLISNLNSRYIVFEFKNYSEKITQGQILTTEKYLLEKGLRRVAFILSRKGANDGAIKTTQGAMRENGKLIIVLNDEEVCKMLQMKERGEDPSDYLFKLTDNFLLTLPR